MRFASLDPIANDKEQNSMMVDEPIDRHSSRLKRLLTFVERDPDNSALVFDAAALAFDEGDLGLAADLIRRVNAPTAPIRNLAATIAIAEERLEDAVTLLSGLFKEGENAPAVRFNLAWSLACLARYEEAEALLRDEVLSVSPRAPSLRIKVLHHLERYEEALKEGESLMVSFPENRVLAGALATLAMDADREELARHYATQAGDNPEGLTAGGMFSLQDQDADSALALFDKAIAVQPDSPRAWVGKGLALLARSEPAKAAEALDHGAGLFGDHLGSWIAAGWASFIAGDLAGARDRFERVVALDGTFSEGHGGLAVIDIVEGNLVSAQRNADIAMRLDRVGLGGALAGILLMQAQGRPDAAERIRAAALTAPIGPGGKTLAQMLAASVTGLVTYRP